jgi:ribose transport system permease protein
MTSTTTTTTTRLESGPTPQVSSPGCAVRCSSCSAFVSLIAIIVFFSIVSPYFFTPSNLVGILMAATVTGILALGTTFVIVSGGIDLSIGTGMILCGVMTGVFLTYWGWPLLARVLGAILFGGLIGLGQRVQRRGAEAAARSSRPSA